MHMFAKGQIRDHGIGYAHAEQCYSLAEKAILTILASVRHLASSRYQYQRTAQLMTTAGKR
jgi:hypothetical protein